VFHIHVFGKEGCAKCMTTRQKLTHMLAKWAVGDRVVFDWFDMGTEDGLTEGAFNDVGEIPTTLLLDDAGNVLARWEREVPPSDALRDHLAGAGIVQA
jgi:hypothetical protein